ncbi:hypothetical protein D049_2947B, partial [Vibrio parahaemolyticus VPTS-2010]
QSE